MFLVGDHHVEHVRARMRDHLLERIDHLRLVANLAGLDAKPPGDLDKSG